MTRTAIDPRVSERHDTMSSVPALRTTDLIGRDAELEQLTAQLGIRTSGDPSGAGADDRRTAPARAVLVGGDAGVGKTRLLMALRDAALEADWQVVAGHCLDLADSSLPYLPFSEILGRLMADLPDVAARVLEVHPTLARLQPGRRIRSSETASGDQALDRGNVYDAFGHLLAAVAERAPVLVVVEDAHWADESTRDMLSFLFSRPVPGVALVVSYRADDLHRRHPLRRQVAEWMRLREVERLAVEPLADDDVRRLVRALHPSTLSEAEYVSIVDRAEGNPFFIEELVGAAWSGQVPGELADVLLVHLDRLDETTRRVVRLVSVAGRQVSHSLLAAVSDLDSAELEAALRTAVDAHVLVASRGGTYAFRHALLGEAVYDDLLPGERMRLHAAFVAALGEGRAIGTAAELAQHARRADDRPVAVRASIEAGEEALAVGGPVGGGDPLPRRARAGRHRPRAAARRRRLRAGPPVRRGAGRLRAGAQGGEGAAGAARGPAGRGCRRRPRTAAHGPGLGAPARPTPPTRPARSRPRPSSCCGAARPSCSPGRSSSTPRAWAGGTPTRRGASRSQALELAERNDLTSLAVELHATVAGLDPRGRCEPERRLAGRGRAGAAGRADRARAARALPPRPAPPRRG